MNENERETIQNTAWNTVRNTVRNTVQNTASFTGFIGKSALAQSSVYAVFRAMQDNVRLAKSAH